MQGRSTISICHLSFKGQHDCMHTGPRRRPAQTPDNPRHASRQTHRRITYHKSRFAITRPPTRAAPTAIKPHSWLCNLTPQSSASGVLLPLSAPGESACSGGGCGGCCGCSCSCALRAGQAAARRDCAPGGTSLCSASSACSAPQRLKARSSFGPGSILRAEPSLLSLLAFYTFSSSSYT